MGTYVGLDVSQKLTSVCVIDDTGRRLWQGSVAADATVLADTIRDRAPEPRKVAMETGPMAVWLYHAMRDLGLVVDCIHARHVHAALSVQINKTDSTDALGIAQLVRSGWYRPVHVRSLASHEARLLLTARAQFISMRTAVSNQIRGILKTFGVVLGAGRKRRFEQGVEASNPILTGVKATVSTLLQTWKHLSSQIREIDRQLQKQARHDPVCSLLMTAPGVGVLTAMSFRTAVDDPARFRRIDDIGPFLGLVPTKYQSGDVDRNGSISKHGNRQTRAMLFEAAGVILQRSRVDCVLKRWAEGLQRRIGLRKATVALARKLATVLLSMWRNGQPFSLAG
jgi:transposase